jgi:type IV secretory pathway TraG/TraD family ATPase VirD4
MTGLDVISGPTWVGLALAGVGFAVAEGSRYLAPQSRPTTHGDSRWARERELRPLHARRRGGNGILAGWRGSHLLQVPDEDNLLVFGVQRSGKTSTVVLPTLLCWPGAAVATSTKEELVSLTGRHRAGHAGVYVFAPLDADQSWITDMALSAVTWNPVDEAQTAGLAAELADCLTAEGKASHSPHWYLSGANLLTGIFLLVRKQQGDMAQVLRLLNTTHLGGYSSLDPGGEGAHKDILEGLSKTPPEEAGSIISTARAAVSLWLDERVVAATRAKSNAKCLDLDRLLSNGGTLYLVAPAEDAERCRPLFSALLGSLLRRATQRARHQGGVLNPRLLLALDEAANFARVPRLASYISTGPGQGIQSLLCLHDLAQLRAMYGHDGAATIWNNCRCRLLLQGQADISTLELFSRAMGDQTVLWRPKTYGLRGGAAASEMRASRPLLSLDQLRRSPDPVLLFAGLAPARITARRWDQVPHFRALVAASATKGAHRAA